MKKINKIKLTTMKNYLQCNGLFMRLFTCFLVLIIMSCTREKEQAKILIFAQSDSVNQEPIPALEGIMKLASAQNIIIGVSDDAAGISDNLGQYDAVVFLGDFGARLSKEQQQDFEEYVGAGGGFMGIESELNDPKAWPWYANMYNQVGSKPGIVKAGQGASGEEKAGPAGFFRKQEYAGGRVSLIGMALPQASSDVNGFQDNFLSGLGFIIGSSEGLTNGEAASANGKRFTRRVLQKELIDGVKIAIAGNGDIYYIERAGKIFKLEASQETMASSSLVGELSVSTASGNGLIGMVLDPDFETNNLVYVYYTPKETKTLHQKLSRFHLSSAGLDLASEKVLLTVPYDFRDDGHTGGAMVFDDQGNLFLSTGDNTNPHEANGFGPLDERPGRNIYDAQRTAGNTANLLGKILRIKPQPDGTYTIPEGNLFTGNDKKERPEIYVMGCRNPYTMSFDSRTGFLYWGEVGPDAGRDSTRGSRGYDEINQVRKAGFYGWPFFIGQNKAYADYDFTTQRLGAFFDPAAPVNNSVHNTGSKVLPPAQPAFIAYPYTKSEQFPELGEGTRCAIAGPVYHYDPNLKSDIKFPEEYDNVLFVADWSRNWVMAVHMDEQGNYARTEPFMALTEFDRPLDLKFGPDGALYLLEYGEPWGMFKTYGTLVRLEHNTGNRPPLALASASDTLGHEPLTVKFSDKGSLDYDGDAVKKTWTIAGQQLESKDTGVDYTFRKPGQYLALLTVTDAHGKSSQDWINIKVGNARPVVQLSTEANQTFYWDNMPFDYQVKVQDQEDGAVDPANIQVNLDYLPEGKDVAGLFIGSQDIQKLKTGKGSFLMAKSDCKTCHTLNQRALGPSLEQIADRYSNNDATVEMLAKKVVNGGSGMWGTFAMSAHPQVSHKEATAMVRYILSLDHQTPAGTSPLPAQGQLLLNKHAGKGNEGLYILTASYTDKGSSMIGPLSSVKQLWLRNPQVYAADFTRSKGVSRVAAGQGTYQVSQNNPGDYISFKDMDLRHVDHLTYSLAAGDYKGFIEVRLGSPRGPVVSRLDFLPSQQPAHKLLSAAIKDPGGKNELYFVFGGEAKNKKNNLRLDWISFNLKPSVAKAGKATDRSRS
jgi:cytochrome c